MKGVSRAGLPPQTGDILATGRALGLLAILGLWPRHALPRLCLSGDSVVCSRACRFL